MFIHVTKMADSKEQEVVQAKESEMFSIERSEFDRLQVCVRLSLHTRLRSPLLMADQWVGC